MGTLESWWLAYVAWFNRLTCFDVVIILVCRDTNITRILEGTTKNIRKKTGLQIQKKHGERIFLIYI